MSPAAAVDGDLDAFLVLVATCGWRGAPPSRCSGRSVPCYRLLAVEKSTARNRSAPFMMSFQMSCRLRLRSTRCEAASGNCANKNRWDGSHLDAALRGEPVVGNRCRPTIRRHALGPGEQTHCRRTGGADLGDPLPVPPPTRPHSPRIGIRLPHFRSLRQAHVVQILPLSPAFLAGTTPLFIFARLASIAGCSGVSRFFIIAASLACRIPSCTPGRRSTFERENAGRWSGHTRLQGRSQAPPHANVNCGQCRPAARGGNP